jgi:hypothetical protein
MSVSWVCPRPGAGDLEGRYPTVDLPAERGHVAHGQQPVPDAGHLVQEFLGVTEAAGGDLLFERPHPFGRTAPVYRDTAAGPLTGPGACRGIASRHSSCWLATASTPHRISLIRLFRSIAAPVNYRLGLLARLVLWIMAGSGWSGGTRLPGTDGAGFSRMPVMS